MKRMVALMILATFFSCVGISEIPAVAKLPGMIAPVVSAEELSAEEDTWNGGVDYSWYDDQSSPYIISTAAQFAAFGNILNKKDGYNDRFTGKTIRLMTDLNMDNIPFRAMGGGTSGQEFAGTFEGNGHIIKNLNINELGYEGSNCAALFACMRGGSVRNLGLENVIVEVPQGSTYQAAFIGYVLGNDPITIENCFVRNVNINVTAPITNGRIGGFAGFISPWHTTHTVKNCYSVNVSFSKKGDGDVEYGFGHFSGLAEDKAAFINCYSGGVTEKPADSTLPGKVTSFGIYKGTKVTNCYSDCYADDANFDWHYTYGGFTRGASNVSTDDLKTMGGEASDLSGEFYICDVEGYNFGYPILSWEVERFEGPLLKLSVERKSKNGIIFDAVDGAEFSANGRDWQSDREFRDLPPGTYVFRARRDSESDEMTVKIGDAEPWDGTTVDYSWYDDKESPYTIETAAQLAALGNILNNQDGYNDRFAGKTIELAADLDMGNMPFRAMGGHVKGQEFSGTFEGNGHIIKNLKITQTGYEGSNCVALFACIRGAKLRNLGLENVTVGVSGPKYQAAFVGYVLGDSPSVIENCFVRDVNITVSSPIADGRIGGFAGFVTPWNANHTVKNCYSVNVNFSRNGGGDIQYGLGHFAGLTEEKASFINCYSGGVTEKPAGSSLPNKVLSFAIFKNTIESNCYSDCYSDDGGLDPQFNDGFTRAGLKVSTDDLKGMTGDVALGDGFGLSVEGNYGYPQLLWELERLNQSEEFSAANFEIATDGSAAQVNVSGLKNNLAEPLKPLLFIIAYNNGRIVNINIKEIEMEAYDYMPEGITLSVDMSGADTVRAFMLKGADNVVPVLESKEVKK